MRPPRDRRFRRIVLATILADRSGGGAVGQMIFGALALALMIAIVRAVLPVYGGVTEALVTLLESTVAGP